MKKLLLVICLTGLTGIAFGQSQEIAAEPASLQLLYSILEWTFVFAAIYFVVVTLGKVVNALALRVVEKYIK